MHPVLFQFGSFTIYTYGFCLALGAVLGFTYMAREGRKQFGLSLDHASTFFFLLIAAGIIGGKIFFILEDPAQHTSDLKLTFSGGGFVFYGSLLFSMPIMFWFFKRHSLPVWAMLDVMAIAISILHVCGRMGCFMAGCDYGLPTDSVIGVIFTNPICQANPLNTPLHPTQLYEAGWVLIILTILILCKRRKAFEGQLFLIYLIGYGMGRIVIEFFRGDVERGFILGSPISTSQFISFLVIAVSTYFYVRRRNLTLHS